MQQAASGMTGRRYLSTIVVSRRGRGHVQPTTTGLVLENLIVVNISLENIDTDLSLI